MTTATQPFSGIYSADSVHSSFGFGVRYAGAGEYRGTFDDVRATLDARDGELTLEGAARAESISIREPEQFRAHVLSAEFFDVDNHPEVSFRSTGLELSDDGTARLEGELTIRDTTRPIVATGTWLEPQPSPSGVRGGLKLETVLDRRDFGFDWQLELPGGGDALGYEVTLTVNLVLAPND